MKILRINSEKDIKKETDIIVISVGGKKFTITEEFGAMGIHANDHKIVISPACANEILINTDGGK